MPGGSKDDIYIYIYMYIYNEHRPSIRISDIFFVCVLHIDILGPIIPVWDQKFQFGTRISGPELEIWSKSGSYTCLCICIAPFERLRKHVWSFQGHCWINFGNPLGTSVSFLDIFPRRWRDPRVVGRSQTVTEKKSFRVWRTDLF